MKETLLVNFRVTALRPNKKDPTKVTSGVTPGEYYSGLHLFHSEMRTCYNCVQPLREVIISLLPFHTKRVVTYVLMVILYHSPAILMYALFVRCERGKTLDSKPAGAVDLASQRQGNSLPGKEGLSMKANPTMNKMGAHIWLRKRGRGDGESPSVRRDCLRGGLTSATSI